MLLPSRPTWDKLMLALTTDNLWPLSAEYHFPIFRSILINKKTKCWTVNSTKESWNNRSSQKENEEVNAWIAPCCFCADYMFDLPFPISNFQSSLFLSLCFIKSVHTFTFSSCRSKTWNGGWKFTNSSEVPIGHRKLSLDDTRLAKLYV